MCIQPVLIDLYFMCVSMRQEERKMKSWKDSQSIDIGKLWSQRKLNMQGIAKENLPSPEQLITIGVYIVCPGIHMNIHTQRHTSEMHKHVYTCRRTYTCIYMYTNMCGACAHKHTDSLAPGQNNIRNKDEPKVQTQESGGCDNIKLQCWACFDSRGNSRGVLLGRFIFCLQRSEHQRKDTQTYQLEGKRILLPQEKDELLPTVTEMQFLLKSSFTVLSILTSEVGKTQEGCLRVKTKRQREGDMAFKKCYSSPEAIVVFDQKQAQIQTQN